MYNYKVKIIIFLKHFKDINFTDDFNFIFYPKIKIHISKFKI